METAQELCWSIDGLDYAALAWGDASLPPAIALHGWLDNALSFSALGPLLTSRRLIALDLSGHGLSSHRAAHATYQIWDDLPQIAQLIDQLGAEQVTLIGHSRGASIATLLASLLGERCDRLVLIDGLLFPGRDNQNAATQLSSWVSDRQKYAARGERYFDSVEAFIESRSKFGFSEHNGRIFAPRALEETPEGFRLRSDSMLFGASATKIGTEARRAYYASITAPVMTVFGEKSFLLEDRTKPLREEAEAYIADYRSTILPGSHHLHLESHVDELACQIDEFVTSST